MGGDDNSEKSKAGYTFEGRIMAWFFGVVIVVILTAQFWTSLLDKKFPLHYDVTSPAQRVWQMKCGPQVSDYLQRIANGC